MDGLEERLILNIEKIGNTRCLVDIWPFCDPVGGPLRCYEEVENGIFQWDQSIPSCTYTNTSEEQKATVKLSPNPVSNILSVDMGSEHARHIYVINAQGQAILQEKNIDRSKIELKVEQLPSGLYNIIIEHKAGAIIRETFIKQ